MRRDDHVCRIHEDVTALRGDVLAFLTEGLQAGRRLEYAGGGTPESLREDLAASPGFGALLRAGDLGVRSLADTYGPDEVVDPAATVAAYGAATDEALERGYTGLRVVAEATSLVRTPAQRAAFARYEHLVDRYMLGHPFSALCAYDARELGAQAAAELACLHPRGGDGATTFRWYAEVEADAGLSGEVDIACHELFDVTLARTMPVSAPARFVVDARSLEFIDHRGLLVLDRHAREAGTQIALRTDARVVHRLADLLGLRAVHAERAS